MKIALLGDSIRLIGYGTKVPAMLGEAFEVYQPSENCRFSKYTQWCIHDWCKKMDGCRIIHWNNGLWDVFDHGNGIFSSEEEYLANMLTLPTDFSRLRQTLFLLPRRRLPTYIPIFKMRTSSATTK